MGLCEGFLWGTFGGFLAELLRIFKLRHLPSETRPLWLKSPFYWALTILMILAGGGLVIIYVKSGVPVQAFMAVNLGASAPLILGSLADQTPAIAPGKSN
jgi:hypothetical protein